MSPSQPSGAEWSSGSSDGAGDRFWLEVKGQPWALRELIHRYREGELKSLLANFSDLLRDVPAPLCLTGMGASYFAGVYAQYWLDYYGQPNRLDSTSYLADYGVESLRKGAVLLVLSQSGETIEARQLLERIGDHCRTVVITNEPASAVASKADLVLPLLAAKDGSVALQTYMNSLGLVALAIASTFDPSWTQATDEVAEVARSLDDVVAAAADRAGAAVDFLDGSAHTFVIGRGPSFASALEGALLIKETAKRPAEGFESGSFRHGAVEVVDGSSACIILDARGPASSRNRRLAEEVLAYGARVVACTDDPAGWPAGPQIHLVQTPSQGERLAPLAQAPFLQLFAYELARRSGVDPGSFRNTTPIIDHD
jgi:glutamine---fructose-6-phosphate transaminase (isomerizing)